MKTSKKSVLGVVFALFIALLVGITTVSAAGQPIGINIESVEINDVDDITDVDTYSTQYVRGGKLDVAVKLLAQASYDDVKVKAIIEGDEHHDIDDQTSQFDVTANTYYYKKLSLNLPDDMEQDTYLLTVRVSGRGMTSIEKNFNLKIDTERHDVVIKAVDFSSNPIKAGRGLESIVRVKNVGEKDEDYVRISFEIPELGLKAADDYINDLESEDSKSSEPLYVRIPECAEAGTYKGIVTVEFDDGYKKVIENQDVEILDGDICSLKALENQKTTVLIGAESQIVEKGTSGVVYPITLTNAGITSKSYTVGVSGIDDWATAQVSPGSVVIVEAGKTTPVYVYLAAKKEASNGEHVFSVDIKAADKDVETIPLKAVVTGKESTGAWEQVKKALQIGLITVLIVAIVLGVIVAFNRMKGEKEETVEEEPVATEDNLSDDLSTDSYY